MKYENTTKAKFISRPNRFIALAEIDGNETVCHVKNTLQYNASICICQLDKRLLRRYL